MIDMSALTPEYESAIEAQRALLLRDEDQNATASGYERETVRLHDLTWLGIDRWRRVYLPRPSK